MSLTQRDSVVGNANGLFGDPPPLMEIVGRRPHALYTVRYEQRLLRWLAGSDAAESDGPCGGPGNA